MEKGLRDSYFFCFTAFFYLLKALAETQNTYLTIIKPTPHPS